MSNELRDITNVKSIVDQLEALSTIYGFHADYLQDFKKHLKKLYANGHLTKKEWLLYSDLLGTAQHKLREASITLAYAFADDEFVDE